LGVVAAAGYSLRSPDSPQLTAVDPQPAATLSAVTLSTTSITVGEPVTLSTTISDGLNGLSIDFYNQNGVKVGSATTNAAGTASLTINPTAGLWVYHANTFHP
jgi:hypothetical protein